MKRYLIILLSCFTLNIGLFSKDIYIPSLPSIAADFHTTPVLAGTSITLFLIGMGISQLLFGPLSDLYGRKVILIFGLMLCLLGNALSVLTHDIHQLLFVRLMAGMGAGACPVITRAIASDLYKNTELTKAISYLSMTTVISPALAPVLGGYFQDCFNWQTSFIFLTIVNITGLLLIYFFLKETNSRTNIKHFKLNHFFRNNLAMLTDLPFLAYSFFSVISISSGVVYYMISPFLVQKQFHLNALDNGLLYIYIAIGYFCGSFFSGKLTNKFNEITIIKFGLYLCLASALLILFAYFCRFPDIRYVAIPMLINATGCGLITPATNKEGMALFPTMAGTAAALLGSIRLFGAFVIGMLTSISNPYSTLSLALLLGLLAFSGLFVHSFFCTYLQQYAKNAAF